MSLPAGNNFSTAYYAAPSGDIAGYSAIIDLSNLDSDYKSNWNSDDNGRQRAALNSDGTELASDLINSDYSSGTGLQRIYVGNAYAAATQAARTVRAYPANTANAQYAHDDTYGSDNAYDSYWWGYWPNGGGTDRTSNSHDMTAVGSPSIGGASGQIGNATDFNGSDQYCYVASVPSSYPVSMMCWHRPDTVSTSQVPLCVCGSTINVRLLQSNDGTRARIGSTYDSLYSVLGIDTWEHFAGRFTSSEIEVYDDGVGSGSPESNSESFPSETYTAISGFNYNTVWIGVYDGIIQEAQLHIAERADDWIAQEYNQTNDNSTFWGTWTWQGGGATLTGTINESAAITDNAAAQATFGSSISESAAISDSDTGQAQFASSIAESAGISDLITALAEMQSLINESNAITDNAESQATFASAITESVNITDLIETLATFQSIINESAAITDFLTAGATIISGTINEIAGISDSLSSLARYISTISESAAITDNLTSFAIMLSSIAESISISEVATAIVEYQSSISESVSITDIVQVILSAIESEIIIRCFKKTDILTEQQKHEHVLTKIKKHIDIINKVKQGGDRCH